MTVTDELRRMLDERGVKWDYGITGATTTRFSVNGIDLTFTPMRDGLVCSTILTPKQAIASTLGTGTCRMELRKNPYTDFLHEYTCSECGESMCRYTFLGQSTPPMWCPSCGRKVVSE